MSRQRRPHRQYAMTPQAPVLPVAQDAAVAALQATTTHLNEKVTDLAKATNDGLQSIAHKLDEISRQSAEIAAISAAQREHGNGLERAFGDIRATNERINAITMQVTDVDKKVTFARGGIVVLSAIGGLMIALLVWALTPILNQASDNATKIQELELQIEKIKARAENPEVRNGSSTP